MDATTSVLELVGNTPLVRIGDGEGARVLAKAEFLDPGGSIKDRMALAMIEVPDDDAIATTRALGREDGLPVGISSGANVWAARALAGRIDGNVATVLPDRAERRFSAALL